MASLAVPQVPAAALPVTYDDAVDELHVLIDGVPVPAVDAPAGSPMTKKRDIEKGEDAKDRW